mmetsp:Transcript_22822/g.35731  ORF Transcript_22822/g.35731 Transcript_22822/m.35731 type:complete len:166 (+) Transcript_22822:3-500(+)
MSFKPPSTSFTDISSFSSTSTPRVDEISLLRRPQHVGKNGLKANVGTRVLMTRQARDFHLKHFGKDISEGRAGIVSIIYDDYCWVNWDNGAASWYNTGRDGRYELVLRPPVEEIRALIKKLNERERLSSRDGSRLNSSKSTRPGTGIRTLTSGSLRSIGDHIQRI